MIDAIAIMKAIEHMETNTPEQREERRKEAFRLIKEREDETMRAIEEKSRLFQKEHAAYIMKLQEKQDEYIMQHRLRIQEIRSRIPKKQLYFGKVKTE
jgi:hypothetical protein